MNKVNVKTIINKQIGSPAYIKGDLFEQLKPFALFDAGKIYQKELLIDWHPHSGVATITFPYSTDLKHADSEGNGDTIKSRGLQWMASGSGVWHKEHYYAQDNHIGILQLWLLLAPEEENNPVNYFNLQADQIPQHDNVRVLLGEYNGIKAAASVSHNVTFLHIKSRANESFNWTYPDKQTRGFIYPLSGSVRVGDTSINAEQMGLLEEQNINEQSEITVLAETDSEWMLALVEPWKYNVISHYGQIHTSQNALDIGTQRIKELSVSLQK